MNHHDDEQDFRELPEGAAAPFPSEDEWLDLPLPAELSPAPSGGDSFAERVLAARREERQLDRALADLDEVLPAAALQAFRVPEPSPGFVDETVRQVEEAVRIIGSELGMICASYTARTPPALRRQHLADFAAGAIQVLVAIRCLDEGVDVPATRTAFLLASSTNPRQFVQRRGRVLRRFPGKSRADIYDFFVVPDPEEYPRDDPAYSAARSLVRGQLARSREFIELAQNGPVAGALLRPLRDHFDLLAEG